jgi:hypothetical protein
MVNSASFDARTIERLMVAESAASLINGEKFMPFKSQAQRRKFAQLLVEGKISNDTFEEWNRETGRKKLPERVRSRAKASRNTEPARRPRATSQKKR